LEPEYQAPPGIELFPEAEITPEPEPARRIWGFWPTVGFTLAIGFVILMVQVVLLIGLAAANLELEGLIDPLALEEYFQSNLGLIMALTTVISGILGIAGIIGVIKMRRGASVTEYLGLRRISLKQVALLLLITLALIVALDGLSVLLEDTVETGFDTWMYDTSVWPVLIWLAVVVFAPLQEEVLFRGFLFEGLRYSRLGAAGAIVITSLVWAALHVQYSVFLMGNIFLMGLVLGVVRLKTKSLWGPLLIHAGNNLTAMVLMTFNMQNLFK
jgi:CAAX protease family protein